MADMRDNQPVSWEVLYERPLDELEQQEIQITLCDFFKLMSSWKAQDVAEAGAASEE